MRNAGILVILVGLLVWSPSLAANDAAFSVYNDGPDGLGHLAGVEVAHGPFAAAPDQAVLVVGPRLGYTDGEARAFQEFLHAGGRALVADATGSARTLLARVPVDITEAGVFTTSYAKNPEFPIAESTGFLPETILSRPHVVEGEGDVLLASHAFSWKDLDNDLQPDLGEPVGAWPLAMRVAVGQGEVIVVGDPDIFTQEVSEPTAEALLAWLSDGRTVIADEGHRAQSDPIGATAILSGARPGLAVGIAVAVCAVAAVVAFGVRVERKQPKPRRRPAIEDPVLDELPDAS